MNTTASAVHAARPSTPAQLDEAAAALEARVIRPSIAGLVRDYRARIALDPALYDGDLDVTMWLLQDTPSRSWTPSELGKVLGVETPTARRILDRLAGESHIRSDERGAWTRYSALR